MATALTPECLSEPERELLQPLAAALADCRPGTRIAVACSGGRDSMALLHCASAFANRHAMPLRAIHINHQLQQAASAFEALVRQTCGALDIPFCLCTVVVSGVEDDGLEAAARKVRYAAFAGELQSGEILLLAHHRQDQAETFLLQALRGSGPAGLAAMPAQNVCGQGQLRRPWLQVDRASIVAACKQRGWPYIDDPSNSDLSLRRNALRALWPRLQELSPGLDVTLARAAQWQAQALELQAELAAQDLQLALDGPRNCLQVEVLNRLGQSRAANLLRHWLHTQALRPPQAAQLQQLQSQLQQGASDTLQLCWADRQWRCYRQCLFVLPQWPLQWRWVRTAENLWQVEGGWAELRLQGLRAGDAIELLEWPQQKRLQLNKRPSRTRKQWMQQIGVPPWLRATMPALIYNGAYIALADTWRSPDCPQHLQWQWSGIWPELWQRCRVGEPD